MKKLMNALHFFIIAVLFGLFCEISAARAFEAAKTFDKKCSSCHSIGGGDLKGPDLKGVSKRREKDWLIKFIQSSDAMIQAGDPIAVKIYNDYGQKDMPDQKLSDSEVVELLQFIDSGGQKQVDLKVKSALDATSQDIAAGLKLYMGQTPLANGGPACVSCHSVSQYGPLGGGTLAKNLTFIYSDYKDKGLSVALKKLGFPVMQEVYNNKSLTDVEAFQIKAFLYDADKKGVAVGGNQKKFMFLGLGALVVALGVIDFAWRRRRKKSVRRHHGGLR